MAMLHKMLYETAFSERYCYIASDGYAYEKPKGDKVSRYAHDGGTRTADYTEKVLTKEEVGEELWKEIWHAFLSNRG